MLMHYRLGQWLHQHYIVSGFLNATYNKDALHVRSTDKDRTLMSAEADLSGLYPPTGNQIWEKGIEWMPIPVHTVPLDQDYVILFLCKPEVEKKKYSRGNVLRNFKFCIFFNFF